MKHELTHTLKLQGSADAQTWLADRHNDIAQVSATLAPQSELRSAPFRLRPP
jgi:hypothetical protein